MNKENESASCCLQEETHCPVEATIGLIGGKYKSLILWKLAGGTLRFSQLKREVSCATPKMLTQQLRELEADGLIVRKVFPVVPPKVEYSLTDFGKSIRPVLEAMLGEVVIWPGRGWPRIVAWCLPTDPGTGKGGTARKQQIPVFRFCFFHSGRTNGYLIGTFYDHNRL